MKRPIGLTSKAEAYLSLWITLDGICRQGDSNSFAAGKLREEMDRLWPLLTEKDVELLRPYFQATVDAGPYP